MQPDTLCVDVAHEEMVADSGDNSVPVFPRTASGDVRPIRKIGGPKTHIDNIFGLAVDSVRNLIIVANRIETGGRDSSDGILIFNRTDNGDVAPRAMIAGPHTGIIKIRQVAVDEARGQIFATVKNNYGFIAPTTAGRHRGIPDRTGFIGVWSVTDSGDVVPRGVIKGPGERPRVAGGAAINPISHELHTIDSVSNALFTFSMPEFFLKPPSSCRAAVMFISRAAPTRGWLPVPLARQPT